MAEAAKRSSANTDLYVGTMQAKIGLFPTKATPAKTAEFDTAGPNGGTLRFEQAAQPQPVGEAEEQPDQAVKRTDPLGDDPGSETPPVEEAPAATNGATVPGEFSRKLVEDGTDRVVEPQDIRRGVRMEDGKFIDCTEQVEAIVERTKLDRIEVVAFIDSTAIRRDRVIGSYYVGAQDDEAAAYLRLFFEGMKQKRAAAIVKYTTKSRQNLGAIVVNGRDGVLELLQLVWAEDFREAPAKATAIQKVAISEAHVEKMGALIERMHDTPEAIEELRDDAVALREELRARAEAGEMDVTVVEPMPVPEAVPDLEGALKDSLDAVRAGKL